MSNEKIGDEARQIVCDLKQKQEQQQNDFAEKWKPDLQHQAKELLPEIKRRILDAANNLQEYIVYNVTITGYADFLFAVLSNELIILLQNENCKVEAERGTRLKISWKSE